MQSLRINLLSHTDGKTRAKTGQISPSEAASRERREGDEGREQRLPRGDTGPLAAAAAAQCEVIGGIWSTGRSPGHFILLEFNVTAGHIVVICQATVKVFSPIAGLSVPIVILCLSRVIPP